MHPSGRGSQAARIGVRQAGRAASLAILLLASQATTGSLARGQENNLGEAAQARLAEWREFTNSAEQAYERGDFGLAVELGTRALALAEVTFGADHPATMWSANGLAAFFQAQGRYTEAEPLYARALRVRERILGRDHPETLTTLNNLASLYQAQGRYSEAEPLYVRALEASVRVLGAEHSDTLNLVANLAVLYKVQGRYADAEPLYLRALRARERLLGPDHSETLVSVGNLARLYQVQGRYTEAEPLLLRALDASGRTLGQEHPNTLSFAGNLADLYSIQGRYPEAERLLGRVVEARQRLLGAEHPHTLLAVGNLAGLYKLQGRYAEAEPLYLRVIETSERLLGRDHADVLALLNNLAGLYRDQDRNAEAEPLYLRVMETRERVLGREHADTLNSLNSLGLLYEAEGRHSAAQTLFVRVIESSERVLGRQHPATLTSVSNLARLYEDQGRYGEAEPLYVRALAGFDSLLGTAHPSTVVVARDLAWTRLTSGRGDAALDPARLIAAALRSRRATVPSGPFAEAQRGREEIGNTQLFAILADAAWSARSAAGQDRARLRGEAFAALQDATVGTTSRAVLRMAVLRVADDAGPRLGNLVRERDSLHDQWAANSTNYSAALAASDANAEALRQSLLADRSRIEARMNAIDSTLRRDFPQYFALVRPEALDVAAAQAMLAPDEAILMVVPTEFGTHVMAIDHDGIDWVRSTWTRTEVDGAVGQLLGNIRQTLASEDGSYYQYDRQTAFALYRQVVAPVAARLQGKRHVFVVASGSLTSIPLGILVTEEPQGANDDPLALRATPWFANAHALIAIPSIQSLQFLRRYGRPAPPTGSPAGAFVGFGNPVLDGPPNHPERCTRGGERNAGSVASVASGRQTRTGGMLASVSLIRTLCPLPNTATELESMRAAFQAPATSLFTGVRSTEHGIRTMDLSGARILALATHGLVAGDISGASEPGLIFTPPATATDEDDGYLTASEVSALRLDADWVILSACKTAAGDGSQGAPGMSGLARAFFYAGARNLLASHWDVVDEVGPKLTVRTIILQQQNPRMSRAEALQQAMKEVREARDDPNPDHVAWAHPAVWAPFSLIGDGAR